MHSTQPRAPASTEPPQHQQSIIHTQSSAASSGQTLMAPSLSHTIQPAILPQQSPTPPDHPLWLKVLCSHVPAPPQCFLLVSLQGCGAQPLHPLSQHLLSLWHGLLLSSHRDPRRHRGRRWLCAVHLFWWDFLLGESWQSPSVPFNHIHPHPHKSNSQTILFPLKSAPAATD